VKTGVAAGSDRTEAAARAAVAAAYRLRADAMALDETQALHLWGEGRRDEVRP